MIEPVLYNKKLCYLCLQVNKINAVVELAVAVFTMNCVAKVPLKVLTNSKNYKTAEYLCMKSVLDSIELLANAKESREGIPDILGESHVQSYVTLSVRVGSGWADSLLSSQLNGIQRSTLHM